jgi:hypothetical protein
MNDEALNGSIRKCLKTVGVNSLLAIERAVRQSVSSASLKATSYLPARTLVTS